jgi:O-antigen/teichoic acid export membrane protein
MLPLINSNKPLISKFKNFPLGVRAGIWFAFLQYAQQAIIILATPIFTRIMPSEEYGLINVYNTWQSLLSIILTLKLSASIYQLQMVEYKDDKDNLTASLVTISNIILIIASVAFLLFGSFFSIVLTLPSEMLYIMMGDIWSQMIISFWLTRNKFEYKYQICLIVVLSNCFFRTISSIILVYMASNNQAVYKVLGNLIPELIYAVCILILIYRKGKKEIRCKVLV